MDFQSGHIDSGLDSSLTFRCIFYYDFISIFFIGTHYMIHDGKKWVENLTTKNLTTK